MSELQVKFIELEKKKEAIKLFYEEFEIALKAVAEEVGVNNYFQDVEGIVYKIVVPEYKTVKMEHIGYIRTKRQEEKRGSLSVKEAKEAGFNV